MLRIIRETKPRWIIAENVSGFFTNNGGLEFENCLSSLEDEGYETQTFIIPACAVNAPHRRDRVWIVAYTDSQSKSNITINDKRQIFRAMAITDTTKQCEREQNNQTNTKSKRRQTWKIFSDGNSRVGKLRNDTDTTKQRLQGKFSQNGAKGKKIQDEQSCGCNRAWEKHWFNVAIQFCRLDDGLPAGLARRERQTIFTAIKQFGREEVERTLGIDLKKAEEYINRRYALSAYGNSIVPQVAVEIMKAIKETDKALSGRIS